jgi:excinuclease UvrABC nuclease subunit
VSTYANYRTFVWMPAVPWLAGFDFGSVPEAPGFYVFTDFAGALGPSSRPQRTVLYLGQTVNLRRRLRQHYDGRGRAGSRISFQTLVWRSQGLAVYVRWATDRRASIERDLINELRAVHNDELSEWS